MPQAKAFQAEGNLFEGLSRSGVSQFRVHPWDLDPIDSGDRVSGEGRSDQRTDHNDAAKSFLERQHGKASILDLLHPGADAQARGDRRMTSRRCKSRHQIFQYFRMPTLYKVRLTVVK